MERSFFHRVAAYIKTHLAGLVFALDAAIVPGIFLCRWLLQQMLDRGQPCKWTLVGAKCATCGGTHCVLRFLQGDFAGAFAWNPMVFCWLLYAIATGVFLNLRFVFRVSWAGRVLRAMYSLTAFFAGLGVFLLYTLVRNIPFLWNLCF